MHIQEFHRHNIWHNLNSLSLADRLEFFEAFHLNHRLTESNHTDYLEQFRSLFIMSDSPDPGGKYITVPVSLVNNKIMLLDKPQRLLFLKYNSDNTLTFVKSGKRVTYPNDLIRDVAVYKVFTFIEHRDYDNFRAQVKLAFGTEIDNIQESFAKKYINSNMKISEVLTPRVSIMEGGNIWKDDLATMRINRADVVPTVQFLEKVTGLPLLDNMLGSTGKKDTSGDLDLAVDAGTNDKASLEAKLQAWARKKDPTALTKKTGISVHFRTPIKGDPKNGYVQTDFMFVPDLGFAKWAMEAVPSKYKGADRQVLFASIAKSLGYKWSAQSGLLDRATNKPIPGGKDKATVAKLLLGPQAKADDITSVESILDVVMRQPDADAKLTDFRDNMAKSGIAV